MPYGLVKKAFEEPKIGYRFSYNEAIILSLAINVLSLALPLFTLQAYDRLMRGQNEYTLYLLSLGLLFIIVLEVILRIIRAKMMAASSASFEYVLSSNTVRHTLQQSSANNKNVGAFLKFLQAGLRLKDITSAQLIMALIDVPFILVYVGLIYYLAGPLALVPLMVLCVMMLQSIKLNSRIKYAILGQESVVEERYDFLMSMLNQIHSIKSYGLEDSFLNRFLYVQKSCTNNQLSVAHVNNIAFNQGMLYAHSMMILVAIAGGYLVIEGQITLGVLIAAVLLSGRIIQPMQKLLNIWSKRYLAEEVKKDLNKFFTSPVRERLDKKVPYLQKTGHLKVENVCFGYEGHSFLLENVSLELNAGDAIAILGDYGSGKNTLLKLISGNLKPVSGQVRVNGVDPYKLDSDELLTHIGYLPFESVIFKGSIWDNLFRFGYFDEKSVLEVAELLGVDEEVSQLPAGYETPLQGNGMDSISPGLRQRIALVRILAAKPKVIVYYFSEEALDKSAYTALYELLLKVKSKVTLIITSNDPNITALADTFYEIKNNTLVRLDKNPSQIKNKRVGQ